MALIVGGELSGKSTSSVEVFSPDGGCQYSLATLPLPLTGLALEISVDRVMGCSGYDKTTLLNNQKCWRYSILYNSLGFMAMLNSTKPKYPAKSYRNYFYFINDAAAEYYTNFSPGGAPSWRR